MQLSLSQALKEWAIAVNTLQAGKTIMLLRKGGIHEEGGKFKVAHQQVLLYPTYEHQQPILLKPEYAGAVSVVASGWHPEMVDIGGWAEITDILPVSEESVVRELEPFHVWNQQFITERLKWKPRQPLYVLLLRTYELSQVQQIPFKSEYGGCKSWIDLGIAISIMGAKPVLDEFSYGQLVEQIRAIIAGENYIAEG